MVAMHSGLVAMRVSLVAVVALAFGFGLGLTHSTSASAATSSTVTIASGSPTVVVSGLSKGDVVDVQATLSSSDPGEVTEAEVEPLVLQSTGGFSFTVPGYGVPRAMRFTATVDGESLSGFIQNYDNDETASVTVTVNSTAQQIFSPQTTDLLVKVAADQNVVAIGSATAAGGCTVGVCATFYDSFGAATWLSSVTLAQLALDASARTPDPNYTVVQQPVLHLLPDISAQDGLTPEQADLANQLVQSTQSLTDVGKAIQVTANRAQSAADAQDVIAQQQQAEAMDQMLEQYSNLLAKQAALRQQIVQNIGGSAFAAQAISSVLDVTITPDDVFTFETGVATNGLPDPITQTLTQLGASGDEMDTIQQLAIVQDPQAAAGEYPARIADPTFVNDLLAAAARLRADLPPTIAHLIEEVKQQGLPRGIEKSLLAKLTGAQQTLNADQLAGTCDHLGSFINQVSAQSAKKLDAADARALTDEAKAVRRLLGCGRA
jgi:hypothetical protein